MREMSSETNTLVYVPRARFKTLLSSSLREKRWPDSSQPPSSRKGTHTISLPLSTLVSFTYEIKAGG